MCDTTYMYKRNVLGERVTLQHILSFYILLNTDVTNISNFLVFFKKGHNRLKFCPLVVEVLYCVVTVVVEVLV